MGLADRDYMKAESWQCRQRERLEAWHSRRTPPRAETSRRQRLAPYAAVAVIAIVPASIIGYAAGAKRGPFAPGPALIWGGEAFTSKADFAKWLQDRGGSYATWARNHPAVAAQLEGGR